MTASVNNCCGDPRSCGGCSIFNEHRGALRELNRSHFAGRAPLLGSGELSLPALPPGPTPARRAGRIERIIAGPQGDVTLKRDFLEFLGCLAVGTGLALVLIAIVMAARVLLGAQS